MKGFETQKSSARHICFCMSLTLLLSACKDDQKVSIKPETNYDFNSEVFSYLLASEESSLVQIRNPWKLRQNSDGKIWFVRDTNEAKGSDVYISIYDRYKLPPLVNTYELINGANSNEKVSEELVNKLIYNRDTSKFEVKINGKYKVLLFNEDLIKKPHFTIESLPRKYVKSYCKVGFSKPIFDANHKSCLVYMENYCSDEGKIFYMQKRDQGWAVVRSSFCQSLVAPM